MNKHWNFIVLTCLFFGWGFITVLNDLLTPILKNTFMLNQFEANFVAFAFFIAYFVGGLFYFVSSLIGVRFFVNLGYKGLILLGLILAGIGCLIFIPAGMLKSYPIFLIGLFAIGFGFAFLQIAANPLVLISGEQQTAASRLNFVQGFNSLASTLAPILGVLIFYKLLNVSDNHESLKYPYLVFFIFFMLLAFLIKNLLHVQENHSSAVEINKPYALNHLNLIFGAVAIFFYVGSEVSIGTNFITLLKSNDTLGLSENVAGSLLAFYWGGAMIGRFLGGIALSSCSSTIKKLFYMVVVACILTGLILFISSSHVNLIYYMYFIWYI
ncbi:MAG: MFS transporter, partial [Burkholderiales bacterium]|nr:MFS transporter [Burkholderiales bacterium]